MRGLGGHLGTSLGQCLEVDSGVILRPYLRSIWVILGPLSEKPHENSFIWPWVGPYG